LEGGGLAPLWYREFVATMEVYSGRADQSDAGPSHSKDQTN